MTINILRRLLFFSSNKYYRYTLCETEPIHTFIFNSSFILNSRLPRSAGAATLNEERTRKRGVASFLPGLETLQGLGDVSLMELGHVGVHLWIVVPDVPLGAPVGDGAKTKRRREVVGALELEAPEENG